MRPVNATPVDSSGPDALAGRRTLDQIQKLLRQASPPGLLAHFSGTVAPEGWLLCDGSAVSRKHYLDLWDAIGTTHGAGDGSTTFNVPDLRGLTMVALDNLGGTDAGILAAANTLGGTGGAETHTLASGEMPSHTHTQDAHTHTIYGTDSSVLGGTNGFGIGQSASASGSRNYTSAPTTATNQNTGGGGAHNNMQPYMLVGAIIRF